MQAGLKPGAAELREMCDHRGELFDFAVACIFFPGSEVNRLIPLGESGRGQFAESPHATGALKTASVCVWDL